MSGILLALVFLWGGLAPPPVPAQTEKPAAAIEDFAWLAGTWRGQMGDFSVEVTYSDARAGLMMGMFRLYDAERTRLLEFFSLRETPEGLVMRVRHFDLDLVPGEKDEAILLRLVESSPDEWLFENPLHGRPKTTRIVRTGPDSYVNRAEIFGEAGLERVIEVAWERAGAD